MGCLFGVLAWASPPAATTTMMAAEAVAPRGLGQHPDDLLEPAAAGHLEGQQSEAVINGEKLALKQAGNKVGKYTIKYVSLDDSTAQNPGTADEGQTAQNARKAVQDKSTIFYLGEFNSGGTKVSIPILNKAGILQISPANTYVGLTTDEPGTEPGEPDKYYPAATRTYARVVPLDDIQGAALVTTMKEDGCKSVNIFNDKTTYGAGLGRNIEMRPSSRASRSRATRAPTRTRRTTARWPPDRGRLLLGVGRDRRERRAGVQGRGRREAGHQAVRAGRRGRGGVHRTQGGRHPRRHRRADEGHGGHPAASGVRAQEPAGQKFFADFRQGTTRRTRPVRDLRLRDDGARARHAQAPRRQGQRPRGRARGAPQHEGPRERARHVLDRRERGHHAHRLRPVRHRGRRAHVRQGDQGRRRSRPEGAERDGGRGGLAVPVPRPWTAATMEAILHRTPGRASGRTRRRSSSRSTG